MNDAGLIYDSDLLEYYEQVGINIDLMSIDELRKIGNITTKSNEELRKKEKDLQKTVALLTIGALLMINTKKEAKKVLIKSTKNNIKAYNKDYDENIKLDKKYTKVVNKILNNTDKDLKKMNKSISLDQQKKVGQIFRDMYKGVQSGNVTYDNAFKNACEKLVENKISFKDKAGRERRVDAVVRQELQYQMKEQEKNVYKVIAKELGTTGWQVTHTSTCRPSHREVDGEKFTNKEWEDYQHILEEPNCYHRAKPIFYDLEDNMYSEKELKKDYNKTYTYGGKKYESYDAQQLQRGLERNIRYAKEEIVKARQVPEADISKYNAKLSKAQAKMRSFIKETGLERDYLRERYAGYN